MDINVITLRARIAKCVWGVSICMMHAPASPSVFSMHQNPRWFPNTLPYSCQRLQRLILVICAPRTSCSCVTWSAWRYHNHQFYSPPTGKRNCFLNRHFMKHLSKAYYTQAAVAGFASSCSTQVPQHELAVLLGKSWVSVVPEQAKPNWVCRTDSPLCDGNQEQDPFDFPNSGAVVFHLNQ